MKKINLNGISEILSVKELKNVVGGAKKQVATVGTVVGWRCYANQCYMDVRDDTTGKTSCDEKVPMELCETYFVTC
jgi:natural product precursor